MEGVWMDPVMAQVMMTFDFARMDPPLSGVTLAKRPAGCHTFLGMAEMRKISLKWP
jgi:hypothetical protein